MKKYTIGLLEPEVSTPKPHAAIVNNNCNENPFCFFNIHENRDRNRQQKPPHDIEIGIKEEHLTEKNLYSSVQYNLPLKYIE